MKNRNILIICYKRPYPILSGSEVRMFQFIKMLSEDNNVDIVFTSSQPEKDSGMVQGICRTAYIVKKSKNNVLGMLFGFLFGGLPLQVGQGYSRRMNHIIKEHAHEYDYIIGSHIRTSQYLLNLNSNEFANKLFFDSTDSITLQSLNAYRVNHGWRKIAYYVEFKRLRKYEKKVFEEISKSSLISERDRNFIVESLGTKANPQIITNYAIDLGYKPDCKIVKDSLTFMGKMDYQPNRVAVLYFLQNIYPKLKEKKPSITFHVIGGNVPDDILKYNGVNGIEIHGFVEDAASFLQKSDIVIAPMRSGAGLQNKIVQAMLLGCTVITSDIGADGLDHVTEKEIVIYTNDDDFIDKVIFFLDEKNVRIKTEIGNAARKYVMDKYGYEAVKEKLINTIEGD